MLKKLFAMSVLSCALAASCIAFAEGQTMADYDAVTTRTSLSKLTATDVSNAKATAGELKEIGDWYRRVGYYLGDKDYALSTGWAPQKVQLITPYSLTKYLYFDAANDLKAPDKALLDEVAAYKDIVWVWVWSNGSYGIINTEEPAPKVVNVVIKTPDNNFNYYLDKDKYIPVNAISKAKVDQGQLWPFPAKLFSQKNIPFDIIVVDDKDNKKPLPIQEEDLAKCK